MKENSKQVFQSISINQDQNELSEEMGFKIHPSPDYQIPLITRISLSQLFSKKEQPAQEHIFNLISYINDKTIIEDNFSRLPSQIQNQKREAKKIELYQKHGPLFLENYETNNKLRSIHTTNVCATIQLLSLYSDQSKIKKAANTTKDQILFLINGPEQDICSRDPSAQSLYNSFSFEKKVETIHAVEKLVLSFLEVISD